MMPYIEGMAKTARLEFRVEPALKARLEVEADRRGQKLTTFVERAVESALGEPCSGSLVDAPDEAGPSAPSRASVLTNTALQQHAVAGDGFLKVSHEPRYGPKRSVKPIPKGDK